MNFLYECRKYLAYGLYSYIISTLIFGRLILVMSSDEEFDDAAYREYEDQLYHDQSSSV